MKSLFTRPKIDKKIDSFANEIKNKIKSAPPEIEATPITTLTQDIYDLVKTAEDEVKDTIELIVKDNIKEANFKDYHDFVQANYWNPLQLIDNPKARPPTVDLAQAKILEQRVFLYNKDPRSIYVQDLFRTLEELGAIRYGLDTVWAKINWTPDSTMARFVTDQVELGILNIVGYSRAISLFPSNGFNSIQSLVTHYLSSISTGDITSYKQDVENLKKNVKAIKFVASSRKTSNYDSWYQTETNLRIVGGSPFWKAVQNNLYFLTTGFVDRALLDVVDLLDNITKGFIDDSSVHAEVYRQTELALLKAIEDYEARMIVKKAEDKEKEELRNMRLHIGALRSLGNNIEQEIQLIDSMSGVLSQSSVVNAEALLREYK